MNDWREPITDRRAADAAGADAGSLAYQKGALNADDLNRIEGNYRYLMEHLATDSIFIPHAYRNREETTIEIVDVSTEYTPVEYIQSSGTQYIDTGFVPNQDTRIIADAEVMTDSSYRGIFGSRDSSNSGFLVFAKPNGSGYQTDYATEQLFPEIPSNVRRIVDKNKALFIIDGETIKTHKSATFSTGYSVFLFAINKAGTVMSTYMSAAKLYLCKIYDNDTLIRDFIPVKDASGVACLFDKVSQTYFYNAGTGEFTAGAELPKESTKEIIEAKRTYTDWQEHNLPWLSEINRIRANYNALVRLFLVGLGLPVLAESNYLDWQEVNDWERIAAVGKTMFESMEQEFRFCGAEICGGDRLL